MTRGARPTVQAFTTRLVTHYRDDANGNATLAMEDKARFAVLVCVVKSGSRRALFTFEHFAGRYCLEWEAQGADGGNSAHGPDVNPDLNAHVECEYLVWGLPSALFEFVEANTGNGKCLASWHKPVAVRVASSSGSAPTNDTTQKRIREMMRPRVEREAHERRRELNKLRESHPDSPYHTDRARLARFKAQSFFQVVFDTSDMRAEELEDKLDRLTRFYAKHDRAPSSIGELFEETTA